MPSSTGMSGQMVISVRTQSVFVDNGTGSSVTNLAGFIAFERAMQKILFRLYATDPKSLIEWFDKTVTFSDAMVAAVNFPLTPSGTADTLGLQFSPYAVMNRTNIGTQTVKAPTLTTTGLSIVQDSTAGEGSHTSALQSVNCPQQFVVGKGSCSVSARVLASDWTKAHIIIGFRTKEVYTADYNDYTDLAAIGTRASGAGDVVATLGILAAAATVETVSSTVIAVDTASVELVVKVDGNGYVTATAKGKSFPIYSAGTTQLKFAADTILIPFYQLVNVGSAANGVELQKFVAVANSAWQI